MGLTEIVESAELSGAWELGEGGESFAATTQLPDGRTQRVSLRLVEAGEGTWLRIFSRIGEVEAISPRSLKRALELNFEMLGGAIALQGDDLVVVHSLIAEEAGGAGLREAVESVALLADEYERALFGTDAE